MRRFVWVPVAVLALTLGACSTGGAQQPRTVTEIVTQTGTPPASAESTASGSSGGITVVNPSGSGSTSGTATGSRTGSTGSTTASIEQTTTPATTKTTPTTTRSTKTTPTKKIVKVNPLQVSCAQLLDANDIRQALGARVSSSNFRIVDVANPDVKMTGKVKCYFGAKASSKVRPVTVALAQYKSAAAAQSQMSVTVQAETSLGAKTSTTQVSGYPAHILLRDGGLLVMRYDTWTLSVAVDQGVTSVKKLPTGLHDLARMVLARVLKSG
jgi:hypothetical protein